MADALTRISERLFGTADTVRPDLAPVVLAPGGEFDISYQDASTGPMPEAAWETEAPHPKPPAPHAQGPAAIRKEEPTVHNDYDTPSRRDPSSNRPRTALRSGDRPGRFEPGSERPDSFEPETGGRIPPVVPALNSRARPFPESPQEHDAPRDIEPVAPPRRTTPPVVARRTERIPEHEPSERRESGRQAGRLPEERPNLVPLSPEKMEAFDLRFDATVDRGSVDGGGVAADDFTRDARNTPGDAVRPAVRIAARADRRKAPEPSRGRNDGSGRRTEETGGKITITIGRIDVRAVHAPPPPVQSAPRRHTPSLTLDDYLKQHNGGGG